MNFKFYVQMDGQEFGPYSLEEIKELPLLEDTLVTESRLNGEWHPACEFDFEGLSRSINEPSILNTWNWGAFMLSWLWGIYNDVYWPLLIIVCNFIPYIGPFIGLGICIYLGIHGNALAWDAYVQKQNKESHTFIELQTKWNKAGIIVLVISILLSSLLGAWRHFYM